MRSLPASYVFREKGQRNFQLAFTVELVYRIGMRTISALSDRLSFGSYLTGFPRLAALSLIFIVGTLIVK